jgi:hypothetical protein
MKPTQLRWIDALSNHHRGNPVEVIGLILSVAQMAGDVAVERLTDIGVHALETGDLSGLEALLDTASEDAWRVARQRLLRELFAEDWSLDEHG